MIAPELVVIGLDGAMDSYVAEKAGNGELPNFARLMKRGCRLTDLRPPHPTVTPVCWASFITGATPEVHGIISDLLHLSGDISHPVSGYHGDFLLTERFWESAAKAGKTALVDSFPASGPLRDLSGKIWQVEGTTCMPGRMLLPGGTTEYEGIPQQIWLFDKEMNPVSTMKKVGITSSLAERCTEHEKERVILHVKMDSPACNRNRILPFDWEAEYEDGKLVLSCEGKKIPLLPGEWAEGIRHTLPAEGKRNYRLAFRFILLPMPEGYLLFSSASGDIRDRIFPEEFAALSDDLPPTPVHYEYLFFNNPATYRIAMDSWIKRFINYQFLAC